MARLKCFGKGDIMLADSYYASYFLIAAPMKMGVDVSLWTTPSAPHGLS
jgi:hypothetical protein